MNEETVESWDLAGLWDNHKKCHMHLQPFLLHFVCIPHLRETKLTDKRPKLLELKLGSAESSSASAGCLQNSARFNRTAAGTPIQFFFYSHSST